MSYIIRAIAVSLIEWLAGLSRDSEAGCQFTVSLSQASGVTDKREPQRLNLTGMREKEP